MLPDTGPYISAAFLCEKILQEADGVKSAIRIVDRVTHTVVGPDVPETMPAFDYDTTVFIRFKAGSARGPARLEIRFENPSGESKRVTNASLNFEGEDDRGIDIPIPTKMRIEVAGLYWFVVYLDGEFATRIPLRVIYSPAEVQPRPR